MRENTSTEWVNKEVDSEGNFNRQKNQFETPFGEGEGKLPVEPGRYRLLWAPVCPWAHRSVIVRRLLGLEDVISLGTADPKRPDGREVTGHLHWTREMWIRFLEFTISVRHILQQIRIIPDDLPYRHL